MVRSTIGAHHFFVRHPNPEQLSAASPATAFLDLRWNEFFDKHTIDTFRPRFGNLPTLVAEIFDTCGRVDNHPGWASHLVHLQAELKWRLVKAREFGWLSSLELWQLEELAKVPAEKAQKIAAILNGGGFQMRYEARIFAQAGALPSSLPQEKKKADAILNQLATIALQRGFVDPSSEDRLLKSPTEWVDDILHSLQGAAQEIRVYVTLVAGSKLKPEELSRLLMRSGFDVVAPTEWTGLGLPEQPVGSSVIGTRVPALTHQAALGSFIRKLEPVIDMLAFYMAGQAPALPTKGWVGKPEEQLVEIQQESSGFQLVQSHSRPGLLVGHALEPGTKSRFEGSVSSALDLHATAMRAADVRTRFLNLWMALECLGSLVGHGGVIQKISDLVCPIVTWRKIEKISRYCSINIHHWRRVSGTKSERSAIFPGESNSRIPAGDAIALLGRPKDHQHLTELSRLTGGHPLLVFRLMEVWERFRNPQRLSSSLAESRKHLEWHLNRIYRARNLLVHSGTEVPYLEILCENLHYYVNTVLSRVIHGVSVNKGWSPADSARHWVMLGDFVIQKLDKNPQCLSLEHLMPEWDSRSEPVHPWIDWVETPPTLPSDDEVAG